MRPAGYIQSWRLHKRMSQQSLAKQTGLTQAAVSAIEAGQMDPRLSTLARIAGALEIPIESLFSPPPHHRPMSRFRLDRLARAVVTGDPQTNREDRDVITDIAALISQKLLAHRAQGSRWSYGKRWNAPHRTARVTSRYGEEIVHAILARADRWMDAQNPRNP